MRTFLGGRWLTIKQFKTVGQGFFRGLPYNFNYLSMDNICEVKSIHTKNLTLFFLKYAKLVTSHFGKTLCLNVIYSSYPRQNAG
jgi:hypothetical protein